jgi:hypothetical protein
MDILAGQFWSETKEYFSQRSLATLEKYSKVVAQK